ncbi:MAG TPA: hypothetical protein VJV78_29940 [Polyangiales bacterium]|nr:hypothetical protein [Polyangiales bacterium]
MIRNIISALIVAVCTLVASQAHADRRVTVHDFYGPNAEVIRDDVVNLLERQSGLTIVSKGQIEAASEKLGVDPFSPEGRIALARELSLSAWMTGVVQKRSGKLKLTVAVFDGAQHLLVGRARLQAKTVSKLSIEIHDRLWRKSRSAIMHAAAPAPTDGTIVASAAVAAAATAAPPPSPADMVVTPAEAEAPAPAAEAAAPSEPLAEDSKAEPDSEPSRSALAAVDADYDEGKDPSSNKGESLRAYLGLGSPYRNLSYDSPITSSLGDYQLPGAPMLDLNVQFHPARLVTDGWASWFGLDVRAQFALGAPTVDRAGHKFSSRYDAYHFGLRARVPVGRQYVSAFSGYAMNRVNISSESEDVSVPSPSVDYRMIRTGAGGEFALSDSFGLALDAAWLAYLSAGDMGRWFPRATATGLEVSTAASYNLTSSIFARVAATYQVSFFDFNPRPDDKYAAGGATDQYLSLSLGAGVKL